jgi:hypothetical protein
MDTKTRSRSRSRSRLRMRMERTKNPKTKNTMQVPELVGQLCEHQYNDIAVILFFIMMNRSSRPIKTKMTRTRSMIPTVMLFHDINDGRNH